MQVFCSNCNTAHEVTYNQATNVNTSVISCRKCDKKIKFQFCPHCGAFYSITFSNIKHGRYKYSCKRCMKDFAIEFSPLEQSLPYADKKIVPDKPVRPEPEKISRPALNIPAQAVPDRTVRPDAADDFGITVTRTEEPASFISNSINSFSSGELFKSAYEAFTARKITVSAAGVICMMLSVQLFNLIEGLLLKKGTVAMHPFAGSLINLFPLAIIFSFYTLFASVVAKITLDRIFHSRETAADEIIRFTFRTGPGVFAGNIMILLAISGILILFGRIPFLGPLLFSLAFLPVYLISVAIFLLCFIGLWFYPPISAHRESGIYGNLKNLTMFVKKHNFNIIFMIPVILLVTAITFSLIFFLHLSAFSLSMAMSKWLLNQDASMIFSSIPALFIKASEAAFSGFRPDMFKELNTSLQMTHHIGGFILGIIFLAITLFLLSLAVSITATISSHIYIVMERGISIDDRKKAIVLFVLMLLMTLLIMLRKLI